jgi:hypothetical protein
MTIQGNGTVRIVVVIKHLGIDVKQPKCFYVTITKMVLLMKGKYHICYKTNFFSIGIINLLDTF